MARFIHASDVHLGSHQFSNPVRSQDFFDAFSQILQIAKENCVDFLILGGDVFDTLEILPKTMTQTIKILTEFYKDTNNSIPIIAIEGNHDLRKFIGQVRIGPTESWLHFLGKMGYVTLLDGMDEILKNDTFQEYSAESKIGGTIKIGNIRIFGIRYCGKISRI